MAGTRQMGIAIIMAVILTFPFIPVSLASIDEAKGIVDDFYRFSKEKDVESYADLFDQEYLKGTYGDDYATYFEEGFALIDIESYELDYQYYTESDEGLTLLYTLQAKAVIDGEDASIDNDLAALFTKDDLGLKLKYVIPQSTMIEQMNRETILLSSMMAAYEEENDIQAEAEEKGISTVDMEALINEHKKKHGFPWFWVIVLLVLGGVSVWKRDIIMKHAPGVMDAVAKNSRKAYRRGMRKVKRFDYAGHAQKVRRSSAALVAKGKKKVMDVDYADHAKRLRKKADKAFDASKKGVRRVHSRVRSRKR